MKNNMIRYISLDIGISKQGEPFATVFIARTTKQGEILTRKKRLYLNNVTPATIRRLQRVQLKMIGGNDNG